MGHFEVSIGKDGSATTYDTATYTNAVVWREGGNQWTLDRFKGTLKSKDGSVLICARDGGRQF